MKTNKLIEIARNCFDRTSKCENCILHTEQDCTVMLINELADKLEMAVSDINKNCGNCMYKSNDYRQLPCSVCEALEFSKWEWQGDAE